MDSRTGVLGVALKSALFLAERQGVASERLLDGLGLSVADAQRAWTRVPWNVCAEVFTRIGRELGMERLSRAIETDFFESYSELTPLLTGADDPAWLFRFIYLHLDPLVYPMVDFRLEQLGSDRLRIAAELRPGFDGSESFFFGGAGATPTTTTLMGLPPALTEIQAGPRGSLLTVCLPRREPDLGQRQRIIARRMKSDVYNQLTRDRRKLLDLTLENLALKERAESASLEAARAHEERRTLEGAMEEAL